MLVQFFVSTIFLAQTCFNLLQLKQTSCCFVNDDVPVRTAECAVSLMDLINTVIQLKNTMTVSHNAEHTTNKIRSGGCSLMQAAAIPDSLD